MTQLLPDLSAQRRASQSVSCKQKLHRRDAQPFLFSSLSNAAAFTQFNYEPVSPGNSGAKEGLLMGNSPERSVVSPPSKKQRWCSERGRERGETVLSALKRRLNKLEAAWNLTDREAISRRSVSN